MTSRFRKSSLLSLCSKGSLKKKFKVISVTANCVAVIFITGCSALPNSGPTESELYKAQRDPNKNLLGFGIVQISPDLITIMESESPKYFSSISGVGNKNNYNDNIGPGDILQVSIYEIGDALFGGSSGNASGIGTARALTGTESAEGGAGSTDLLMGNSTTGDMKAGNAAILSSLPPLVVSSQGNITVPYVGVFHVAGSTPDNVATEIRIKMARKSQAPQVIVRILQGVTNSAIVYGDVKRPGRVTLTQSKERLLDVIAIAQGTLHRPEDSVIQLTRADQIVRASMGLPENNPGQNIEIQPGDRIEVIYKPRTFTAFGAAGKVTEIPFDVPELSLAEALARAGGPNDNRADPNGVFLLRFEDNNVVQRLGFQIAEGSPVTPIVYQIDMMNPGSYFLAQRFSMKDKDMLYFSNSKTNEFYKLFGLISTIIQPGITAGYMAR